MDVAALIQKGTSAEMNAGRFKRSNLDSRIDEYAMVTITSQDLAVGLQLLRAEENNRIDHQMVSSD